MMSSSKLAAARDKEVIDLTSEDEGPKHPTTTAAATNRSASGKLLCLAL